MTDEEKIDLIAKALQREAARFRDPVHFYVEREAIYRELVILDREAENYEAEEERAALESWRILARSALQALT